MIYDRTQADIDNAKEIRDKYIKSFSELTDDQITTLERGFLTYNTLNRIENKQLDLRKLLNDIGYWNTEMSHRLWETGDIFTEDDFQRIVDNHNILRNAFFVYSDTPNTPSISFSYEDINSLEKILFDIETMIGDVKSNYRECGNYNCGED